VKSGDRSMIDFIGGVISSVFRIAARSTPPDDLQPKPRMPIRFGSRPHSLSLASKQRLTARCASWSGPEGAVAASPGPSRHSIFQDDSVYFRSSSNMQRLLRLRDPSKNVVTAAGANQARRRRRLFPWPDEKQSAVGCLHLVVLVTPPSWAGFSADDPDSPDDPGHTSTTRGASAQCRRDGNRPASAVVAQLVSQLTPNLRTRFPCTSVMR